MSRNEFGDMWTLVTSLQFDVSMIYIEPCIFEQLVDNAEPDRGLGLVSCGLANITEK